MRFCHFHSAFYVELECFAKDDVARFRQRAYKLETDRVAVSVTDICGLHEFSCMYHVLIHTDTYMKPCSNT